MCDLTKSTRRSQKQIARLPCPALPCLAKQIPPPRPRPLCPCPALPLPCPPALGPALPSPPPLTGYNQSATFLQVPTTQHATSNSDGDSPAESHQLFLANKHNTTCNIEFGFDRLQTISCFFANTCNTTGYIDRLQTNSYFLHIDLGWVLTG